MPFSLPAVAGGNAVPGPRPLSNLGLTPPGRMRAQQQLAADVTAVVEKPLSEPVGMKRATHAIKSCPFTYHSLLYICF